MVTTATPTRLNGNGIFVLGVCRHGRTWPEVRRALEARLRLIKPRYAGGFAPVLPDLDTCGCCHGPQPCGPCERGEVE